MIMKMELPVDSSRMVGDLLGGEVCMFLVNRGHLKRIRPVRMKLTDNVRPVPPGTRFIRLAGTKTSAGHPQVTFNPGVYFEYRGMIRSLDGDLAIFTQEPTDHYDYLPCYWYFDRGEFGVLIFFTRYNSGRTIELTRCEYQYYDSGNWIHHRPGRT